MLKNRCFQIVVLEKTLESPLDARRSKQSILKKSTLNIRWKDWCWRWSSNTLATWPEELTHWKRPWCWERLRASEEGMTEDEMVGWHHWLNGHEIEQVLGDSTGQGSLGAASHGSIESQTWLSNWKTINRNSY